MDTLVTFAAGLIVFALGASIGSFLNVVVYRLPAGLSLLWPPSRCPKCLNRLGARENVPVFGWLCLRGRCRHCRSPISPRYPLVEAATGTLFLLVFWQFGLSWQTAGCWAFFSWLLALSLIDFDTMTLPNPLTQSGLAAGLAFQATAGFLPALAGDGAIKQLMSGIIGAVLGIWLLDIIAFLGSLAFGRTAMGAGDAKLAAMMGAWLGWKYLLIACFLACAIGAFAGGGAIALGWLERSKPMPFGPFLAIGAGIAALWGEAILSTYLRLFFPLS
ncbi:MAG: prepilin peptidase [Oscillatoria princeps RMCB-10]|nr:prepilin peptidase [Oscillatoria princeps RMCB-10]